MNISPGIIATYWLAASFAIGAAWSYVVPRLKRAAHNATARCHCGTCQLMTISAFATEPDSWDTFGTPRRRAYRDRKRLEAQERQAAFDAEVAKVAREQNCGLVDARYVVNARRRHEHRLAQR